MIVESLWPLLFLAAIPIIILFYLLVPKGKDTRVPSNLLWKRLLQNESSMTFWKKLLQNLLMFLQIAIVLLVVLALMSPYFLTDGDGGGRTVYVLDTSGSMKHKTGDGVTRFEAAVSEIKENLSGQESVSLVTADATGTRLVAVNATADSLSDALDAIVCTDADGALSDAVGTVQTLVEADEENTTVLVYTDGEGAADCADFTEQFSAGVRVMGEAVSNVSNTFLSAEAAEDGYTVTAGLVNYSDWEATLDVTLTEDGAVLAVRTLTLAANESAVCLFSDVAWSGSPLKSELSAIRFSGSNEEDSLDADNCAYALFEESTDVEAVLVGSGNTYIEKAYLAATARTLAKTTEPDTETLCIYDTDTAALYEESTGGMVFGLVGADTAESVSLSASDTELTEEISGFSIGVNETYVYDLPEWATGFLWSGDQCAAYYGEHDGVRTVVCGFDIRESDFALLPEFPVFMANALSYLSGSSLLSENVYEAGETVRFTAGNSASAATDQAGLFSVTADGKEESYVVRFAAGQSDGRILSDDVAGTVSDKNTLIHWQLRTAILLLALLLLVVEWLVYVRQLRYRGRFYLAVRLVGAALLLLALFRVSVPLQRADDTTVFLVDLSESNAANTGAMETYLKEQIGAMPDGNQYAIVTFGANAVVEQFLTDEAQTVSLLSVPERTATDIEDAILTGISMIPENSAGRLVVLTDGRQTQGDVTAAASALTAKGAELYSLVYEDTATGDDAYIEDVDMPEYLYQGDAYSMTVTVESSYETDAVLTLLQGTKTVTSTDVRLNKGSNRFVLKQTAESDTAEQYTVRVTAKGDTCAENDSYSVYAAVDALPKILLVSGMDEDSTAFSAVLSAAGCDFRTVSAANAPETLEEMLAYKSIILENVYYDDLPDGFLEQLETYVRDYGCGLVCCGGEDSYALGGYTDTVLETLLPVDMQLRGTNEEQSLALVMVIDHSGSMSSAESSDSATNLDLAITAAAAAVRQLSADDEVGVVTFDDSYTWQVPLQAAEDKDAIIGAIESISEGGGTRIKPAVQAALTELSKSSAQLKHIVLLTDGQGETSNFEDVIQNCEELSVTLSAVAVGDGSDTALLENLADNCGGRYYYSDFSEDIPKIFAQEVFLSGESYLQNGEFTLSMNTGNAVTKNLFSDGLPLLYGYVSTSPKTGGNVLIASDKDDPVLSIMQYGLGHTVAWTSDVTNEWTADLAQSEDYVQLWKRIIDYSAGYASLGEDDVSVETKGNQTTVTYKAKDYTENTSVELVCTDPDGETETVQLAASAAGEYQTKLDTEQSGVYTMTVRRLEDGAVTNALTTAAIVQYSGEYQFALTNDTYVAFAKQYGTLLSEEDSFWERMDSVRGKRELTEAFLLLFLALFLLDIAMRRFSYVPRLHWTKREKSAIIASEQKTEKKMPEKKEPRERKKKEEPQALNTSALLQKKEHRHLS